MAELRKVLEEARRAADSHVSSERRKALGLLDEYRRNILRSDQPELILEAIPVVRRLAVGFPGERDDARQFLETTAAMLTAWPRLERDFEQAVLSAEADTVLRQRHAALLSLYLVFGLLVAGAGAVILILGAFFEQLASDGLQLTGAIMIPAGLSFTGLSFAAKRIRQSTAEAQLHNIETKTQLRTAMPLGDAPGAAGGSATGAGGGEYFSNLVRINVSNLSDYYTQVRVHTNNSFWAAIVAGGLGFVLVCTGVAYGFATTGNEAISYVATASGVIVEFISGVFFYLYNRTVRQLKGYHDSLLDVQNILLAFRIVEEADPDQRGPLFEQILSFLLQKRAQESAGSAALK